MEQARYLEEDLNEFLQLLIDTERFNDQKEVGITKFVIEQGFEKLSSKQKFIFNKAIEEYVFEECSRCGNEIPWSEMSAAEDNGGLCSWCQQLGRNDKD